MKRTPLFRYIFKIFISYFLAIGIPLFLLSMFYIGLTFPKLKAEQYTIYSENTRMDVKKMSRLIEKIYDFQVMLLRNSFLSDMKRNDYGDAVFSYSQVMDALGTFEQTMNNDVKVYVYVKKSQKVMSPSMGVQPVSEYKNADILKDFLRDKLPKEYKAVDDSLVLVTTLPRYYVDENIVLMFYIDMEKLCLSGGNKTSILYNNNQLLGQPLEDEIYTEIAGKEFDNTNIVRFSVQNNIVWAVKEPNSGLLLIQIYDQKIVSNAIASSVLFTVILLIVSLLILCIVSFFMAKVQVKPVQRLSEELKYIDSSSNKSIFDNISDFLSDLKKENVQYQDVINKNIDILKDHTIRDLLWNRIPSGYSLHEYLSSVGIDILPHLLLPVLIQTSSNLSKNKFKKTAEINILVKNILEQHISEHFSIVGSTMLELDQILFIINFEEDISVFSSVNKILNDTGILLNDKLSLQIKTVVGYLAESPEDLCQSFMGMRKLLNKSTSFNNSIIYLDCNSKSEDDFPNYIISSLTNAIRLGEGEKVKLLINQLFSHDFPNGEKNNILLVIVINIVVQLMEYIEISEVSELEILTTVGQTNLGERQEKIEAQLLKVTEIFREQNTKTEDNAYVHNALIYINSNLNKDLALSDVSQYIGINTSYFSRIFKANVGITPLQYITNQRITKAKMLLQNKNMTIKDISEGIGYNDNRSFIRFFKKLEGCTPGEYRERLQ